MNVFIDHRYGSSEEARKAKRQVSWYAKQAFDVTPEHHLYVGSLDDLVTQLRQYTIIEKLIFFPHGIAGAFLLGGESVSMYDVAIAFSKGNKRRPQVTKQIHIASCSVAEVAPAMISLAGCFQSPLIDGYTWHHYVDDVKVPVALLKSQNSARLLDDKIRKQSTVLPKYRVTPIYTTDQLLAHAGSDALVLLEWWMRGLILDDPPKPTPRTDPEFRTADQARQIRTTPAVLAGTEDKTLTGQEMPDFLHIELHMNI